MCGEPTRLRLLALLDGGDLTVTDLTEIIGQSQPRISRHLKLLGEAELIERYQDGAWAYFRLKQDGKAAML
ncbi:ArsR/SmtB family transcription factor, partial [Rhizobium ruizarguesonis]